MGGTLNTQNSKILSTPLSLKYKIVIQVPRAKLRFEVFFKSFHRRINLTTLFLTKTYLLNTIKPFSDHENRSLEPKQQNLEKPLLGGYP
jgi:hypothetical protein